MFLNLDKHVPLSKLHCKSTGYFRNMQYLCGKIEKKMKIVGLGNALMDVLLQLKQEEILSEIGIQKGAMDMINREQMIAIRQRLTDCPRTQAPGGSVCNTMRALAYLGAEAGFIGKIGTDAIGEYYEEALRKAHVQPHFIRTTGESGSCTVMISPDGERTMGTFLGPAPTIAPDEISEELLRDYHIIYIEGYLIVNEPLVRTTMEKAKRLGLKVALDLSNFNIVNGFKPLLEELIPRYVDILFSNESEAAAYTGLPAEEAVLALAKQVEVAIVTIGKRGSLVASAGQCYAIAAEGGKPIDTTGAGDNFAAGFLYGQSVGASWAQSAQIGSTLSGYVIDVVGPQIPDAKWPEIQEKVKAILN